MIIYILNILIQQIIIIISMTVVINRSTDDQIFMII